jgi:hypothetical protein
LKAILSATVNRGQWSHDWRKIAITPSRKALWGVSRVVVGVIACLQQLTLHGIVAELAETDRRGLSLKNCGSVPWYEDPEGDQSPIGSILESISINSGIGTDAQPVVTIEVTLIGNKRDGRIMLTYQRVQTYSMDGFALNDAAGNAWTEDKLDRRKMDTLRHKVTLTGGNWLIEADDVEYNWEPL